MGSLKPGATYVYERSGSAVYAREPGSTERQIVGYTYDGEGVYETVSGRKDLENHILWNEIRTAAKTNPALQKAVDRAIMIYKLSKEKIE
jgi:hypothetical protein